jgi:hypothetical protein
VWENRELRKRNRLLEQGSRFFGCGGVGVAGDPPREGWYPLVTELARDGDVPGPKLSRQPYYPWLARSIIDTERVEAYRVHMPASVSRRAC